MTPNILTIRPGVQFTPPAARSFLRLEHALGRRIDVNSTYRDWNRQMGMYLAWQAYVNGRGPHPGHARAIHPKYSIHCQGEALDSDDWTTPGFIALAADHGWIRTAASDPTEQHHFEYQSWRDQHINEPAPAGEIEEDMPLTDDDLKKIAVAVWNHMVQPQDENGNYIDGAYPARGFLSSAAAQAQIAARETAPRVWAHLVQAQDEDGNLRFHPDGSPVVFPARGYIASTNAQVAAALDA